MKVCYNAIPFLYAYLYSIVEVFKFIFDMKYVEEHVDVNVSKQSAPWMLSGRFIQFKVFVLFLR
jgi:hypothetical protein